MPKSQPLADLRLPFLSVPRNARSNDVLPHLELFLRRAGLATMPEHECALRVRFHPFAEPSAADRFVRNSDVHSWRKSRPEPGRKLFQRLEKNPYGVSEEEFALSDVTRKHRVGGVPGLLPDLER